MVSKIKDFKNWLEANGYRNKMYLYCIKIFFKYLDNNPITEEKIRDFILSIKPNYSINTVNMYLKAIRIYLKFDKLSIITPKLSKEINRIPDSISLEVFEKEIIPIADDIFPQYHKVKTILYFMFYTGVRPHELYNLNRKDIDLKKCRAKILATKTSSERYIIFGDKKVKKLLVEYFKSEHEYYNAFNLKKSSIKNIFITLKRYFPNIKFRPYLLRHSFATYMCKGRMDTAFLMKLMGHTNINTTLRYINTNIDNIQLVYNKIINDI